MKTWISVLFFCSIYVFLSAYSAGQYTETFTDPSRNNRPIQTIIDYPINLENPQEKYPYLVFGHGYTGQYSSYAGMINSLVNMGWIVAYPNTETGIWPSTTNFARDLSFLNDAVYAENLSMMSPLYGKIDTLSIVGGYSMGGACAVVAAYQEPDFNSVITMAAATYLYSSSTTMAQSVVMPSITFSGSADVVAPPSNQISIYQNLASVYKCFISFTNQGHDSFYNVSHIPVLLNPWLSFLKTGSVYYIDQFEALLASYSSSTLTYQIADNLIIILDKPDNVMIELNVNDLEISWDRILEAHNYKVYASDDPYTGFTDITDQGTLSGIERVVWTITTPTDDKRFYLVKAVRND